MFGFGKQPDPIGQYLDLRVEMIYGGHTEEEWNELNQEATALRSQFTHEELMAYDATPQEQPRRRFFGLF
jgi:hypothetical protein